MNEILIFVEYEAGRDVSNPSKSAFSAAKALAEDNDLIISAIVVGEQIDSIAKECILLGASKVYCYNHPELKNYRSLPYSSVLLQTIEEIKPSILIFGYSTTSTDFAPRISAKLNSALITGVNQLKWENNVLIATISALKDKLNFKFALKGNPRMVILGIGSFPGAKPETTNTGEIISCTANLNDSDLLEKVVNVESVEKTVDLTEARFIVSGGRGVGSKENFQVIYNTIESLGGEWASSRAVWDAGWTKTDQHVGQTGQQVSPTVYIAAGISGAIQHVAGIKNSKTIIAINTDPDAPIWEVAHYGIVADLHKVLPKLVEKIKR